MSTEPDWKRQYRRALANHFALGEVISHLRIEFDIPDERVNSLIDAATDKWHSQVDERERRERLT